MNIDTFFRHWGITQNPFKAEEARDDDVYARIMEGEQPVHPDFEKILGSPERPGTSVVFGEKGAGKTAIRLLIEKRLRQWNDTNPERKCWIVRYDDLNPLIDRVQRARQRQRDAKPDDLGIRLADHQDHLLSLVTTQLVDMASGEDENESSRPVRKALRRMGLQQRLDLAELVALYDQPARGSALARWGRMRRLLGVGTWVPLPALGWLCLTLLLATVLCVLSWKDGGGLIGSRGWALAAAVVSTAGFALSFWAWFTRWIRIRSWSRRLERELRAVDRAPGHMAAKLGHLSPRDLATQPLPLPGDQDSRYDLTARLVRILGELGYAGVMVLVDRVDEPAAIQGDAQKMKGLVWPMLHNKFLQQERIGFKMLLPIELGYLVKKEDAAFYQQARLDKQNLIERLEWTGATLHDIATRRLQSCQERGAKTPVRLGDLFEENVTPADLIDALEPMHQPRDAFKFLYQVFLEHCQAVPEDSPNFRVPKSTLDQVRKRQSQRVQELYRGVGAA